VRNHVSNIYAKLQVADRAQAVLRAREAGFGA
jgi:DNA-binding NarL/FixJ family response regulator